MPDLEQLRAKDAHDQTKKVKGEPWAAQYGSYVERFGPAVLTNGLGQALAFERASAGCSPGEGDEQAHKRLYDNIQGWLRKDDGGPALLRRETDLLDWLVEAEQSEYLAAQAETLAWLSWHKKFCQAYLPREKNPE